MWDFQKRDHMIFGAASEGTIIIRSRSRRRVMCSSMVALLMLLWLLHVWVFCDHHHYQAGATRVFNPNKQMNMSKSKEKGGRDSRFHHQGFINGGGGGGDSKKKKKSSSEKQKGFAASKRKVPSCPDPLHNK